MSTPYSYRSDPRVPWFPDDRPIIVFDGHCVLCSRMVQFILTTDHQRRFRLLAAQLALGTALYHHYNLPTANYTTNILIENGQAYLKSDGSIRIFEQLGWPYKFLALTKIIPGPLRDAAYEFIARHRLKWFGARDICYLPDPRQADRFIA